MSISSRTAALVALVALLAIAGAFVAGTVVGDDSGEVGSLKDELAGVQFELDEEASQRDEAEAEADSLDEENENLANQLAAEQDLNGELPSPAATGEAPGGDYVLGAAGIVGDFTMEPSLDLTSTTDGVARWVATITAKNNGANPAELFCGDSGAELVDSLGRTYDGKSVLFREGSANCGDALQPGLTIDDYKMEFSLPADGEPALLELSSGEYGEGPTKGWAVSE